MSSKNAEDSPPAAPASGRWQTWSLTMWLALVNAVTAFSILTITALMLYWGLVVQLQHQNRQFLIDEVDILETLIRAEGNGQILAEEITPDIYVQGYTHSHVRLQSTDGRTLIESPGMDKAIPTSVFPVPLREVKSVNIRPWRSPDDDRYFVTSRYVEVGKSGGQTGILQVALDVTKLETLFAGYRAKLYITLGVGLAFCFGAGFAVARRGTRPLREMTDQAHLISASKLDLRLRGANWPVEVVELANGLNGMLDRLEDSFDRLYNSARNLAHKMRTPITILRGEAEVVLAKEHTAEELEAVIASSLEEYARLSHLSDNILFLARAETGACQITLAELDGHREIEKVVDFYAPLAEEKNITITCNGEGTLTADPSLFRKAVANLLSNAIIYTPENGEVVISIRLRDDSSVEVSLADTGCGIAEAELSRIFDRFYRVYTTRFMDPRGSGLGLCIVKAIMELHHGSIEIRSQLAKGTTASLIFPSHDRLSR